MSIIDYASPIWDLASANVLKPLLRLYKRAIKIVLLKSNTLTSKDYKQADILPFDLKLEYNKVLMMHNVIFGIAPSYLCNSFSINENRHSHKLAVPLPRIDLYKSSFRYSGSVCWNILPESLKTIQSYILFKVQVKKYLMNKLH